ncbi:helix-turn-helix domain-containing protein [Streptomyces sp. P9(2023)]|uniref:helix-turn-helix transcriptional regulator n=1 Tax=Streptomyces sp. P9(2023) TaxID=3064394 RepID=UPI0028F4054F|nr:helix-turn-helix domain-containing protein [Streptomyces sp. P9(2023)]MDT9689424.1 helix-turn-helix domain-containing protein [Streptomyces sp. P9(2023)]
MPLAMGAARYLTTDDVASRYRTTASTVRYWRHIGYGPKGIKIGRRVLYTEASLLRFEEQLADKADQESA